MKNFDIKNEKCPFCQKNVKFISRGEDEFDIACKTKGCYLEYGADWFLSKKELITKWKFRL